MIKIFNTLKITKNNTTYSQIINGEIVKIVAFCSILKPNVKINIQTLDGEVLCNDYLTENKTRFYPKNVVNISQEQKYIENYNIAGPLIITIEGLGDNEYIDNIIVYYK